jgi:hypothetical protein
MAAGYCQGLCFIPGAKVGPVILLLLFVYICIAPWCIQKVIYSPEDTLKVCAYCSY